MPFGVRRNRGIISSAPGQVNGDVDPVSTSGFPPRAGCHKHPFALWRSALRWCRTGAGIQAVRALRRAGVADSQGNLVEAVTYYATRIDNSLLPFHWYKQHVLIGARETGLPQHYIARIESTTATDDPDAVRHAQQLSLY